MNTYIHNYNAFSVHRYLACQLTLFSLLYFLKPLIIIALISTSPVVHSNYNNDMYALLYTNGNTVNDKALPILCEDII